MDNFILRQMKAGHMDDSANAPKQASRLSVHDTYIAFNLISVCNSSIYQLNNVETIQHDFIDKSLHLQRNLACTY